MNLHAYATPAVILDAVHHAGLGIARSLGRLGVPVYAVDPHRAAPALSSKYCKGRIVWDFDSVVNGDRASVLKNFASRIGARPILYPTSDRAALFVADHIEELRESFLFPNQHAHVAHSLASKKGLYHCAKTFGIPTPETAFPTSLNDVLRFIEESAMPVMVKALDDVHLRRRIGRTKWIIRSASELLRLAETMGSDLSSLIFQEYIPGGDDTVWMFNGYFNEASDMVVGFTGKKIRQFPVHTGATSLGICLQNETVLETTRRFMKSIGYRGILDIGYRYDARDGQYKVLDANPRIGSTFRLFVSPGGMDVARAMYLDMIGEVVKSEPAQCGRKWLVEDYDLFSCVRYALNGKLDFRQWVHSYSGIAEVACFAADDPFPAALMIADDVAKLFQLVRRKHF